MADTKKNILVVDPDIRYCEKLKLFLNNHGFVLEIMASGTGALNVVTTNHPLLVILEYNLPDMSGFDVLSKLKRNPFTYHVPVIFHTVQSEQIDRIIGLELGAEDYVLKPCDFRELLLRMKRDINRIPPPVHCSDEIRVGKLSLIRSKALVTADGCPLRLSAMEFKLLVVLMEHCGSLQPSERLLSDLWGYNINSKSRTLDTHIQRLRSKLGDLGDYIETVWGLGYRMRDIPQEETLKNEFQVSSEMFVAIK